MPRRWKADVFALMQIALLMGCVDQEASELRFSAPMIQPPFNERIRDDFNALSADDGAIDMRFGFFRTGKDGGLVSELYPSISATSKDTGFGLLVQTPCLFVGAEKLVDGTVRELEDLRLSWELIAKAEVANPEEADDAAELFGSRSMELGMCSLSTPQNRRLFDGGDADAARTDFLCAEESLVESFALPLTLTSDQPAIRNECVAGHFFHEMALYAVPRNGDFGQEDGTCPTVPEGDTVHHFTGARVELKSDKATGWRVGDGRFSVCGYRPNHVRPDHDASYVVRLEAPHSFGTWSPERWLSPTVLWVGGFRTIARPMKAPAAAGQHWQWATGVENAGSGDNAVYRWAENFTPTVLVSQVEFEARDASGAAVPLRPTGGILRFHVPRPSSQGATIVVICTVPEDEVLFTLADHCELDEGSEGPIHDALIVTPTYATTYLHKDAVTEPITWSAVLDPGSGRTAFIKFHLTGKATDAHMKSTALLDFGRLQSGGWSQGEVLLENSGGQPLSVRQIHLASGSTHPADFSFVVAGDPVQVPLPIDMEKVVANDAFRLGLGSDLEDAGLLVVKDNGGWLDVSLGDPERGSLPQQLTVYGQGARFEGGLLLRDDPEAAFPAASGGRPFTFAAFAERRLPFILAPGESVKVVVTARPSSVGVRTALLRVEAEPTITSGFLWTQSALRVEAVQGGLLRRAPERLWFNRTGGTAGQPAQRVVLVENAGVLDLDVTQIQVQGPHASRFTVVPSNGTPPWRLARGGAADLEVTYAPECDGTYGTPTSLAEHEATIVVRSTAGDVEVALQGSSYGFCELP